jgi:2-methylcitrate dehydratase PrpD
VSSEDPDSDYPQHCPAIIEVTSLGKVHRRHIRFHPGSPEAALSESDVLDKFARNSAWYFGKSAREIGAALAKSQDISLDTLLQRIVAGASPSVVAV